MARCFFNLMITKTNKADIMKITKMQIRQLMINHPDVVNKLRLTAKARGLIRFIIHREKKGITSRELCDGLSISIHNANTQLYSLLKKGYLTRKKMIHNSGSVYYIYFPQQKN